MSVNIKDYGAVGDGVYNDKLAFQAAIAALGANGGTVYVPEGVWTFSNMLSVTVNNIRIVGMGPRSVIKTKAGFTDPATISISNIDCSLEDLKIDLSDAGIIALNCANGTKRLMVDKVYFFKGTQKITINNGTSGTVEDVTVSNCTFDNDGASSGYGILVNTNANGRGLLVQGCTFIGNASDYIEINLPNYPDISIMGNSFSNLANVFATAGFAIGIARGRNISIVGNIFSQIAKESVHIEDASSSVTVVGNSFRECGTGAGVGRVVNIINGSHHIKVMGNVFENSGRVGTAIYLEKGGQNASNGFIHDIVGNHIQGFQYGIRNVEQTLCTFSSNSLYDCTTAFAVFKGSSQTFSGNIIRFCDNGFVNTGWSGIFVFQDSKQIYISNQISSDVATPFSTDETASYLIGRVLIGNQGLEARPLPNSTAADIAALKADFNTLLSRLRDSKLISL